MTWVLQQAFCFPLKQKNLCRTYFQTVPEYTLKHSPDCYCQIVSKRVRFHSEHEFDRAVIGFKFRSANGQTTQLYKCFFFRKFQSFLDTVRHTTIKDANDYTEWLFTLVYCKIGQTHLIFSLIFVPKMSTKRLLALSL